MIQTDLPLVALVGQTNVGKSSLFNALAGRGRAIIAREEHTTRDIVDEVITADERSFRLVDTAGVPNRKVDMAPDIMLATRELLEKASIVVMVVDRSLPPDQVERELARDLHQLGKPIILVLNKSDRLRTVSMQDQAVFAKLGFKSAIETSAPNRMGLAELLESITSQLRSRHIAAKSDPIVKLALIGRPNVGKSSLMNALLRQPRSLVSDKAHTTRDTVVQRLSYQKQIIELVDTAGLRRPGRIEKGIERFSVERTRYAIGAADVCALIIDATELGVKLDQGLAGKIREAGRGLILVVNKIDLVEGGAEARARLMAQLHREFEFCFWAPVVFTSATERKNVTKLLQLAAEIETRRRTEVSTAVLNQTLQTIMSHHPPASTGRGQAKLNYITQVAIDPPTFVIFGTKPSQIHFSYRRYIENQFRQSFDFIGTPIKLIFRDKHE